MYVEQHYGHQMTNTFSKEIIITKNDVILGFKGGTQAEKTASIMIAFEKELLASTANLMMVVGHITSKLIFSILNKTINNKVIYWEASIRS